MSIITTYTCDRCGHKQTTPEQMWNVGISRNAFGSPYPGSSVFNQLWCRACCDQFQIVTVPAPTKALPDPPLMTLEEKIREIMRDEIETAAGARS